MGAFVLELHPADVRFLHGTKVILNRAIYMYPLLPICVFEVEVVGLAVALGVPLG